MCPVSVSSQRRFGVILRCATATIAAWLILAAPAPARVPASWNPPGWWLAQAACIRSHEGWPTANTGNGYYGSYQFLASTWRSVNGPSLPHLVSLREQTYRAWLVWSRDGGSWREWGTKGMCGV